MPGLLAEPSELDLVTLKREIADRIAVREHVEDFLGFLQQQGKQIVLLTNAHQKSVDLKFEHVHIESFFLMKLLHRMRWDWRKSIRNSGRD
ncbi:MAG: hypothetical protein R3E89_05885 [Thiolinea sp.]